MKGGDLNPVGPSEANSENDCWSVTFKDYAR